MNERTMFARLGTAILQAVGFGILADIIGCYGFMFAVRNDHDGQAGMGAFFGAIYLGILVGMITFVVSMIRSRPKRSEE